MRLKKIQPLLLQLYGYLLAIASVAAVTALLLPLRENLSTSTIALIFLLPVLLVSTAIGLSTGLLCGLLSFLTFNFFFLVPNYTFTVHETQDLTALLVFFLVAVLISQLVGRAKENLKGLMTREKELVSLNELTLSLSGQNQIAEIADILAAHIWNNFKLSWVQVDFRLGESRFVSQVPDKKPKGNSQWGQNISLDSPRNQLGEIRIAPAASALNIYEMRMLKAFANQGTMAFERALLLEAETKAKVLEESDRLKSSLLSSVSHEFNTPLATIKASITSLLGGEVKWDSVSLNDLLNLINEETDHLIYLVSNLLNMSRIEARALKPFLQWNVLSEIVEDTLTRMHRGLEGYRMEVDLPDDLPLVPLDYVLMQQVFTNLLSNCAKYSPPGRTIGISASQQDGDLQITVQNQGPPVAPEQLGRIFDKFYRITHAEKVFGTGLGLSICKGIIEAHGGKIWAENVSDGFAFMFTLPLELEGNVLRPIQSETL